MQISEDMFPSDPNGDLGNLRNSLVRALNRADVNEGAAKLLASTLGYAGSVLRKIYKEDDIKSKAQIEREEKDKEKKDDKPSKSTKAPKTKVPTFKPEAKK